MTPSSSSTAGFTDGRTFLNCDARSWPSPESRRQANWRSLQPCTTTAVHPRSARQPGAICNRACSPHYQAAIGSNSVTPNVAVLMPIKTKRKRSAPKPPPRLTEVLDVQGAAALLTVSADVYDLFAKGELPGRKVGPQMDHHQGRRAALDREHVRRRQPGARRGARRHGRSYPSDEQGQGARQSQGRMIRRWFTARRAPRFEIMRLMRL
jgi:hypothetical protein